MFTQTLKQLIAEKYGKHAEGVMDVIEEIHKRGGQLISMIPSYLSTLLDELKEMGVLEETDKNILGNWDDYLTIKPIYIKKT